MKQTTKQIFDEFFSSHSNIDYLRVAAENAVNIITNMHHNGKKMLLCGNGGSDADCQHIAGELLKSFKLKRPVSNELRASLMRVDGKVGNELADNLQQGVKTIPLTTFNAFNTAFQNDCNSKFTFAQLVNVLSEQGDVLFAISTSGNSENVVFACQVAKAKGMKIVALTGQSGGKLKDLADVLLNVPETEVYKIQELHLPVYHLICLATETELFA